MKYELVVVGALETNCYLVYCEETRACAVIDPGADHEKIVAAIADLELKPVVVLNTHGHVDHIGANSDIIQKYAVPMAMHAADTGMLQVSDYIELSLLLGARNSPPPDRLLADGDEIAIGRTSLRVIHMPGHTPGSIGLLDEEESALLSGDAVYVGGLIDKLPESDVAQYRRTMTRLRELAVDVVYPGHGEPFGPERLRELAGDYLRERAG